MLSFRMHGRLFFSADQIVYSLVGESPCKIRESNRKKCRSQFGIHAVFINCAADETTDLCSRKVARRLAKFLGRGDILCTLNVARFRVGAATTLSREGRVPDRVRNHAHRMFILANRSPQRPIIPTPRPSMPPSASTGQGIWPITPPRPAIPSS